MTIPGPSDVAAILGPKQLERCRRGYDREAMNAAARAATTAAHPPAAPLVDFLLDRFFDAGRFPPRERELCLVCLFAARSGGQGHFLAIHLYWALMEGVDPAHLADTLLLTGLYDGFATFNAGVATLSRVLTILARLAGSKSPKRAVAWSNVMRELRSEFA